MRPEPRNCRVSFTDTDGITHSVEVVARSRNEAAIRGVAAFHQSPFTNARPLNTDVLTVEAVEVERHEIKLTAAKAWLRAPGVAPHEVVLKRELRELMPEVGRRRSPEADR